MLFDTFGEQQVLTQLRYADSSSLHDTYLYRLASEEGLNWFKKVLLVSSSQD